MAPWLILAVGAQLILAVVALVDKHIVTGETSTVRPFMYAYITCLMSGASIAVYLLGGIPLPLPQETLRRVARSPARDAIPDRLGPVRRTS